MTPPGSEDLSIAKGSGGARCSRRYSLLCSRDAALAALHPLHLVHASVPLGVVRARLVDRVGRVGRPLVPRERPGTRRGSRHRLGPRRGTWVSLVGPPAPPPRAA